jgi:hypothetical protein
MDPRNTRRTRKAPDAILMSAKGAKGREKKELSTSAQGCCFSEVEWRIFATRALSKIAKDYAEENLSRPRCGAARLEKAGGTAALPGRALSNPSLVDEILRDCRRSEVHFWRRYRCR